MPPIKTKTRPVLAAPAPLPAPTIPPPEEDEDEEEVDESNADDPTTLAGRKKLAGIKNREGIRAAAYKTVDMFSGLTRRRLWLKNVGGAPTTDGYEVRVPFDHPEFYRLVEQNLAHILFRTDVKARDKFVAEYADRVTTVAQSQKVTLDAAGLQKVIGAMANILEDHRVRSLWGRMYSGSADLMKEMYAKSVDPLGCEKQLLTMFTAISAGHSVPAGPLARFEPYFHEALKKVEGRGYIATLMAAKWLTTTVVSELIREQRNEEEPEKHPGQGGAEAAGGGGGGAGAGSGFANGGGGGGEERELDEDWEPPVPPAASAKERAEALQEILANMGSPGASAPQERVQAPKYERTGSGKEAAALAEEAMKTDVNDQEELQKALESTEQAMDDVIAQAQNALRQTFHEDQWLTRDAMAKVMLMDIPRSSLVPAQPLTQADQETINRLRGDFNRVLGKARVNLDTSGVEVDVSAYIAAKVGGSSEPVFKSEIRSQGFEALVLLDRSGSMSGQKLEQAERACRLLQRALKFPFVKLAVWGFTSNAPGEVQIARYEPGGDSFQSPKLPPMGGTPLHTAIRLGIRKLEGARTFKHLFVVTDGFPCATRRDGRSIGTNQLMSYCRDEVLGARQDGIQVTTVLLGNEDYGGGARYDMTAKQLSYMFGAPKHWRMMEPSRLGGGLTKLVSTSFTEFLASR